MMKLYVCSLLFLVGLSNLQAQKKSDLIAQNQELKFQLDSIKRIVNTAQRNEKLGLLRAEEMQVQVKELQDANATLMKNLNSFATLSSQNSENITKTLATLKRKEEQIKGIVDGIASNDSTAIMVLTHAKQTLGENANVNVANGTVIISEKLDFFFADGLGNKVSTEASAWLENIANLIKANPKSMITVASMNITGELDLALQQATSVASILIKDYGVQGDRINTVGADGNLREAIQIKFQPDYKAFYDMAKGDVKN
ncbi:hypothetical protein SAMN04488009_2888 [Maribacter sedimenticola]|uniref:OmpA family protein n=1 Tax=Maribacter sedimenticola TaxID=228956 RepID=A0ABY1SJT4_9FLAO|nr:MULTISPECIES: hypothetical protein [Maribacter]TVZ14045.1 hypothetical protein JM81_0243 [Maribacter sp. MAR_2009_72]SNR63815.1 hypothetical protein SAMN04488009_2888 [Maribacter sedimenticola]